MRADAIQLAATIALALVCGCDALGLGPCPEAPTRALESGTYRTPGAATAGPDRDPGFAHAASGPKTMTVDRTNHRVEIRYDRGGKQVREVWRIKSGAYELH